MVATCRTALSFLLLLAGTQPGPFVATKPAERPAGVFLAGLVVDEQGSPVTGAEIQIHPTRQGHRAEAAEIITAHSGSGGVFQIEGLERGTLYRMITWKPGFAPHKDDDLDPSTPIERHRVVLYRGRTAIGQIVDAAGQPLAGATLDLIEKSEPFNWLHPSVSPLEERLRRVRTDTAGAFTLPDLPPGGYELQLFRPGLAPQRIPLDVPLGKGPLGLGRIEIGGAVLTGKVTDPSGRALAGANVWLRRETVQIDGGWGQAPVTRTGDDGTFKISGLPLYGEVGLDVCAAGYLPEEVSLRDVSSELVPIVLQPGGRIAGRVVDPAGVPVAGAKLYTLRRGQPSGCTIHIRACDWDEDETVSDAEGRFVLEPLLATTYRLRVYAPDLVLGDMHDVRIGPGEVIEDLQITLERGETLTGQVLGSDGRPAAGAEISVSGTLSRGLTGADGRYRVIGIPAGTRSLEILAEGFEPAQMDLEIAPGENRLDASLEALPPEPEPVLREVRGRVTGLGGRPIAGAQVSAERAHTVTDAAGAFSLRVLGGRSYWIYARKAGLASSPQEIEVGGEPIEGLEIRLLPRATITGRVLGLEPEDLASLRVGIAWTADFSTLAGVGKDGTYRLPHIFPGRHSITAEAAGRRVEAEVKIEDGQSEAVLDLHFPPVHEVHGWVMDAGGQPVPRATVLFRVGYDTLAAAGTRANGSYSVRLEDGSYDVAVVGHSLRDDPEMARVEVRGAPVGGVVLVVED